MPIAFFFVYPAIFVLLSDDFGFLLFLEIGTSCFFVSLWDVWIRDSPFRLHSPPSSLASAAPAKDRFSLQPIEKITTFCERIEGVDPILQCVQVHRIAEPLLKRPLQSDTSLTFSSGGPPLPPRLQGCSLSLT
ncbi:hypothetical protein J5N97_027608 [Dioscorea zingiberensis]|uniref:Uncharacterized protein n=1 Tax=Dioscorea zingiberensis TaxID=325984 RepID=A0A9D5C4I9_9LILI|nr:hypothetical protein J5N97_027608 [Dioscorea zingiberensis]